MELERLQVPGGAILFDRSLGLDPRLLFDRDTLRARGCLTDASGGRGSISYLSLAGQDFALRRYLRGGLAARLSRDRYLWLGEARNRAFRELQLLARLVEQGLPVPRPVAASYRREGCTYQAELVTARLPDARSLADRWLAGEAGDRDWVAVGRCLRRFHDAGVRHADLNANNIMLDGRGAVWLLDFDRGRISPPGVWQRRVLQRLARSLRKIGAAAGRDDESRARFAVLRDAHDGGGQT